jgi:hypothetical protein
MMRSTWIVVALILPACGRSSDRPNSEERSEKTGSESFQILLESKGTILTSPGSPMQFDADLELNYTWHGTDREKTLKRDGMYAKVMNNGKLGLEMRRTPEIATQVVNGKTINESSTPEQIASLRQEFDTPICRIRLDEHGAEIGRDLIESPQIVQILRDGVIDAASLFHPPFYADRKQWRSKRTIGLGNSGKAEGELTYEKQSVDGNLVAVKVSGILVAVVFPEDVGVVRRNSRYEFNGNQVYDVKLNSWVNGSALVEGSSDLTHGESVVGNTTVTMKLTFRRLPLEGEK